MVHMLLHDAHIVIYCVHFTIQNIYYCTVHTSQHEGYITARCIDYGMVHILLHGAYITV